MDPFAAYAAEAGKPARPAPLAGPIKTRAAARAFYGEALQEIEACADEDALEAYLCCVGPELAQFENELPFLWSGDGGDFAGLSAVIAEARGRVSAQSGRITWGS